MKRKRRIYFDGDIAYVPLANAKGVAKVDTDDVGLVAARNWSLHGAGYAVAHVAGRRMQYMHRVIIGAGSGSLIDHANQDGLDNRRLNLRVATKSQNTMNGRRKSSLGVRGVYADGGKYRARIHAGGKTRSLGAFTTVEEAARAYDDAAREHFGEFAALNFKQRKG